MDREVQMMVTPRVVEEVRSHFGCSDLEGAELEDQGEEGTALTHWEKRVFEASSDWSTKAHFEQCVAQEVLFAQIDQHSTKNNVGLH
jgi:leishmanolysin-like peptidase